MPDTRGGVAVTIDGADYTMRLGFAAAIKLEKKVGPLVKLAERMSRAEVSIEDVVHVLHAGIGGGLTVDQIGDAVMSDGVLAFVKPATELVIVSLTGGRKHKPAEGDEKKAVA